MTFLMPFSNSIHVYTIAKLNVETIFEVKM
mgnify:CR=1 FL=1